MKQESRTEVPVISWCMLALVIHMHHTVRSLKTTLPFWVVSPLMSSRDSPF